METWTWGPFILQKSMLVVIAAVAAGYVISRLRLKGSSIRGTFGAIVSNALLMWVISWKLSILVFDPGSVLASPMSLLYFSGGDKGVWLATLLSGIYVWFRAKKAKLNAAVYMDSVLVSVIGGYAVYAALIFVTEEESRITWGLKALLAAGLTVFWLVSKAKREWQPLLQRTVVFVVGYALIASLAANVWDKPSTGTVEAGANIGLKIGQQAPDFELPLLDGRTVKLSDYRGRTVVLNFWATWCPPCQAEMPHMQQVHAEQESNGVTILGVNATSTEVSEPVVRAWVKEWGLTFPIVLDRQGEVGKAYRVNAYPATFVIDAQGTIREKHPGPMNKEMLEQAIGKAKKGG
ncbi:peroxiredoxin family protein [Paenibacillus elgii]|uniref:peroxiredoxin family protein n=1 Tax=Paenibacillus elgii TaxID=189691 RepID=UPI0013D6CCF4|nr:redoxin domain-containing protein [Paenibacillus elgii]